MLILVFIILLIIFPFVFNFAFEYNLNINNGYLVIKVWRFKLKKYQIKRKGREIIFIEKHKDDTELEIEFNEEQIRFLRFFFEEIKEKIKIINLETKTKIGLLNPFGSAILAGILSSAILSFFAILKSIQPTASFKLKNDTNFFESIFTIKIYLKLSISIFDVLFSLLIATLKSKTDKQVA